MINNFYMATRLVHGIGAIERLPELLREYAIHRPLIVSDPVIAATSFYRNALDALSRSLEIQTFEGCGIDARVAHIDTLIRGGREKGIDGVIAIGGGSVMCTGKGAAIGIPSMGSIRDAETLPAARFAPLPMIMVPTTAGSGAEVSQFTVIKDDELHRKFVIGGPRSFPTVAVLDPIALQTLPKKVAVISAVDALTHAVEAIFSSASTPLTDALASQAIRLMVNNVREAVQPGNLVAKSNSLLASSMANMACGNTRLCLVHTLAIPLEGHCAINHGIAVGVLLPRVLAFNAQAAPERVALIAWALGITRSDGPLGSMVVQALWDLYDDIGFPRWFDPEKVSVSRIAEFARLATVGLYGDGGNPSEAHDETPIPSPNVRSATVRDARQLYRECLQN